jgi:hypothetical protein
VDNAVGALIPFLQSEAEDFDARNFPAEEVDSYVQALIPLLTDNTRWETASRNARQKIEAGFTIRNMVDYFTREFRQLTTDEHRLTARLAMNENLRRCTPLAGELFTMEMQMQTAESVVENSTWAPAIQPGLVRRGLRYLRREGPIAFIKGVFRILFR